ncbi:hypothetical protein HAX54_035002 [Datura stramonium]|uniref:Mei2-like C-terminal RNA recognition motif domain-containing protein n=1 Tax=Datura stramonium TaxID=4076 RepID=A0ABS8SET0_DATST|nr:hypothetical protein [Datura stramonium]
MVNYGAHTTMNAGVAVPRNMLDNGSPGFGVVSSQRLGPLFLDTRTTLMIKNIPNKYTSKMLLAAIDEQHKGTFDFLYLPIDFKVILQ